MKDVKLKITVLPTSLTSDGSMKKKLNFCMLFNFITDHKTENIDLSKNDILHFHDNLLKLFENNTKIKLNIYFKGFVRKGVDFHIDKSNFSLQDLKINKNELGRILWKGVFFEKNSEVAKLSSDFEGEFLGHTHYSDVETPKYETLIQTLVSKSCLNSSNDNSSKQLKEYKRLIENLSNLESEYFSSIDMESHNKRTEKSFNFFETISLLTESVFIQKLIGFRLDFSIDESKLMPIELNGGGNTQGKVRLIEFFKNNEPFNPFCSTYNSDVCGIDYLEKFNIPGEKELSLKVPYFGPSTSQCCVKPSTEQRADCIKSKEYFDDFGFVNFAKLERYNRIHDLNFKPLILLGDPNSLAENLKDVGSDNLQNSFRSHGITLQLRNFFKFLKCGANNPDQTYSNDLVLGMRVGVLPVTLNGEDEYIFHQDEIMSICHRESDFEFKITNTNTNINLPENEGWVNVAAPVAGRDSIGKVVDYVTDTIFTWRGFPLCLSNPYVFDKPIESSIGELPVVEDNLEANLLNQFIQIDHKPISKKTGRSNPKLRFGETYSFFMSYVNFNGTSTSFDSSDQFSMRSLMEDITSYPNFPMVHSPYITPPRTFVRHDPIQLPLILGTSPYYNRIDERDIRVPGTEGESNEHLVIRNYDVPRSCDSITTQQSIRYLIPQAIEPIFAEWSGMFDNVPANESYKWLKERCTGVPYELWYSSPLDIPLVLPDPLVSSFQLNGQVVDSYKKDSDIFSIELPLYSSLGISEWPNYKIWKVILRDSYKSRGNDLFEIVDIDSAFPILYLNVAKGETIKFSLEVKCFEESLIQQFNSLTEQDFQGPILFRGNVETRYEKLWDTITRPKTEFYATHAIIEPEFKFFKPSQYDVFENRDIGSQYAELDFWLEVHDLQQLNSMIIYMISQEYIDDSTSSLNPELPLNYYDIDNCDSTLIPRMGLKHSIKMDEIKLMSTRDKYVKYCSEEVVLNVGMYSYKVTLDFGDTKHRYLHYAIKCMSRYKKYYGLNYDKNELFEKWIKPSSDMDINLKSSLLPKSISINEIVPLIHWERLAQDNIYVSVRYGNKVRTWLNRDWWGTGGGEQVCLLIEQCEIGRDAKSKKTSTRNDFKKLEINDFIIDDTVGEIDDSVDGVEDHKLVFDLMFDENTKRWFFDFKFKTSFLEECYNPIIKIACIRYQKETLKKLKQGYSDVTFSKYITLHNYRRLSVLKTFLNQEYSLEILVESKAVKITNELDDSKCLLFAYVQSKGKDEDIFHNTSICDHFSFNSPLKLELTVEPEKNYKLIIIESEKHYNTVCADTNNVNDVLDSILRPVYLEEYNIN
jgi:hypothetical protein